MSAADLVTRLERRTLAVIVVLSMGALLYQPRSPRLALGVAGGGVLVGLAYWAIRGAVDGLVSRATNGENANKTGRFQLVKFFTRHVILAFAAYGMMARLELHPIGVLIGVSAPAVAAAVEAVQRRR